MHLRSFLAAAALISASFAAHATTITTTATPSTTTSANGLTSSYSSGVTTITFDPYIFTSSGSTTPAYSPFSSGIVVKGGTSTGGAFAAPNGDTSNYFAVGAPTTYTGSSTFTPGGSYNYFGLYWGSIDTYNTVSFYSGSTLIGSVTGSMVPPANGSQTAANTNEFVNFYLTGGTYDHVVLSTTSANFELDNVTYGNVTATPEPSSIALLGTGFLGIAGVVRRRFRSAQAV